MGRGMSYGSNWFGLSFGVTEIGMSFGVDMTRNVTGVGLMWHVARRRVGAAGKVAKIRKARPVEGVRMRGLVTRTVSIWRGWACRESWHGLSRGATWDGQSSDREQHGSNRNVE